MLSGQMHALVKEHKLDGSFRWLVAQNDSVRNGEIYRFIAGERPCCSQYVLLQGSLNSGRLVHAARLPYYLLISSFVINVAIRRCLAKCKCCHAA